MRFIATKFKIYNAIIPIIKKGLESSRSEDWIDCASGGGSSLISLAKTLKHDYPNLKVTLTDYYPNLRTFEKIKAEDEKLFDFEPNSIDAKNLPAHLQGKFRTIFGAFHHFRPSDAQQILQNAVDTKSPIAIFEPVGKTFISWFSILFIVPNVLIFTPFIRPIRWEVLPFIYLIPLIPLYVLWDGTVSVLRTYSEKELTGLIKSLENSDTFEWEIGSKKEGLAPVHYLLGIPKK